MSTITVDRIIPGALGGTYRRDNIRPACADCNSREGAKLRLRIKALGKAAALVEIRATRPAAQG